jgi:mRNA interferase MazF
MNTRRGDVVLADYSHSLTGKSFRPVVVVQADRYNRSLTNTVVAQITRTLKRADDPAHLFIDVSTPEGRQTGLLHNSVVSCYNLNTVNSQRLHNVIGKISPAMMQQVDACLKAALSLS